MACPFCGADRELTNEHIWPDWLRRRYPGIGKLPHKYSWGGGKIPDGERHYKTPPFRLKARAACQPCNNEWMSRLDDAAKPLIIPMLEGRGKELHPHGQRILARWVLLKTMAAEFLPEVNRVTPLKRYEQLYATRDTDEVPTGVEVWIASCDTGPLKAEETGGIERREWVLTLENGPNGLELNAYLATYSIGHLVLQIFGCDDRVWPAGLAPKGDLARCVRRIYPEPSSFIWPPGPSLTLLGVREWGRTTLDPD